LPGDPEHIENTGFPIKDFGDDWHKKKFLERLELISKLKILAL
jgi:hypothetical protein